MVKPIKIGNLMRDTEIAGAAEKSCVVREEFQTLNKQLNLL